MAPHHAYQLALVLTVLPSLLINRVAATVLFAWAVGQVVHIIWPAYEDAGDMAAFIIAWGAAMGLAHPFDGSRRGFGDWLVALLFFPIGLLAAMEALSHEAGTGIGYAYERYWTWAALLWIQVAGVLLGNDWQSIKPRLIRFDTWALDRLARHFGEHP